jgi:hypothetical protein
MFARWSSGCDPIEEKAMNAVAKNCCSETDVSCCAAIPPEFVRLRYFFGQRLGVVDFHDEQAYHTGKMRFHNRHLHGAGVLCGLRVERFVFPQGAPPSTPTTVLRVTRGAAIDACGREIVAGADQCIDVNAWYQVNKTREEVKAWAVPGEHPLCVGLRFRECPSDPAPAPRDPCGCEPSGCEFGRVRESFELALLTESEQALCDYTLSPSLADIERVLAGLPQGLALTTGDTVLRAIHQVVAAGCADHPVDSWLCLACFRVVIDATGVVTDVVDLINDGPDRISLLPTGVLQQFVTTSLAGSAISGATGPGPRISNLVFTGSGLDAGALRMDVALVDEGSPPAPVPLAEGTFDANYVEVQRYDDVGFQWQPVATTTVYNPSPSHILLTWAAGTLAAGSRYRVTLDSPHSTPVVDRKMRPLSPAKFAAQFRLIDDGAGNLTPADLLF